jgi:glycosyltransferase involved in cell wall biosynthesis
VCVNDGSTDTSSQILHEYQKIDKRIIIINQENSGGSAARNTGIKHATGEYVMFLDSDDIYAGSVVTRVYDRAVETGADVVLYNFARFVGKPTRLAVKSKITPGHDIDFFTKETYAGRFFNDFATITWNKLVKRSVITDNGLAFDVGLSHNHDVDFSIRLMLAAGSYSWINEVGYYYRSNDSGLTATKRNDPTNVLKILTNLNKLVVSRNKKLKQSFDNYTVDMIVGTLAKYGNTPSKQKEVFDFAYSVVVPSINLDKSDESYWFTRSAHVFGFIRTGDYKKFEAYINTPKRKLRAKLRKIYDTVQAILSHFIV